MISLVLNQNLELNELIIALISIIVVAITSFAYHEFAHAIVADWFGDPTPREHGRMTLNPFPHLDVVGMLLLLAVGFGWATTPVRPHMMGGNVRAKSAVVAVAGPLANLFMAILFSIPWQLANFGIIDGFAFQNGPWFYLFNYGLIINVLLLVFNLLPIPPLDGFTILLGVLPESLAAPLAAIRNSGITFIVILGIFFLLPQMGISIFDFIGPIITAIQTFLVS